MDPNNPDFGKYILNPNIRLPSDRVLLTINVGIKEENINITIQSIKKDNKEKSVFIRTIIKSVRLVNILDLKSQEDIQIS